MLPRQLLSGSGFNVHRGSLKSMRTLFALLHAPPAIFSALFATYFASFAIKSFFLSGEYDWRFPAQNL
jgi:hypothetical protein